MFNQFPKVIILREKSKIKLIKRVQVKERNGWECATRIKHQSDGYYIEEQQQYIHRIGWMVVMKRKKENA
jgi:hypothetical protein